MITYKQAARKFSALARVTLYMALAKKRVLMNAFFTWQFSCWPLIWMCHSRTNNKINRLHETCLRIVCNDKQFSFNEFLEKERVSLNSHEEYANPSYSNVKTC